MPTLAPSLAPTSTVNLDVELDGCLDAALASTWLSKTLVSIDARMTLRGELERLIAGAADADLSGALPGEIGYGFWLERNGENGFFGRSWRTSGAGRILSDLSRTFGPAALKPSADDGLLHLS